METNPSTKKLEKRVFSKEHKEKLRAIHLGKKKKYAVWNKDKKLSEEMRQKISRGHLGQIAWNKGLKLPQFSKENHSRWIKDRTKLKIHKNKMYDTQYMYWVRQVKNRDGWKCRIHNGDCSGRLEAHHILPWRDYSELRYEINNGISLCHFHHPRKRVDEAKLSPYFQDLIINNK